MARKEAAERSARRREAIRDLPGHHRVVGHVADHGDPRPGRRQHDVRRLGIEQHVEVGREVRAGGDLRHVGVDEAAHEHQLAGERGELRVDALRKRKVRHRAGGQDRHLVRMRMHLADQERDRSLVGGPGLRRPVRHGGDQERLAGMETGSHPGAVPRTFPRDPAVARLPDRHPLGSVDQRVDRAVQHRDGGQAAHLQRAQQGRRLLVPPAVASHDRQAQHRDAGLGEQRENRLQPGGSVIIVVRDHQLLRARNGAGQQQRRHGNRLQDQIPILHLGRVTHAGRRCAVGAISEPGDR